MSRGGAAPRDLREIYEIVLLLALLLSSMALISKIRRPDQPPESAVAQESLIARPG